MKINGEEVELVTSFDQLRAGMIVWISPCRWCGVKHRSMLSRFDSNKRLRTSRGEIAYRPAFLNLPGPVCQEDGDRWTSSEAVAAGIVYRVVDPKLAATTARKREAVRT